MVDDLIYGKLMDSLYPKSFLMTDEDGVQHEVIHYGDVKNAIEDFRIELKRRLEAILSKTENVGISKMENVDTISRQAAIDAVLDRMDIEKHGRNAKPEEIRWTLEKLPSAQPEPLTDYEQRIFLAAMGKERAVCKKLTDEWDGMKLDVPCPVNLLRLCAEIERKVNAALWTNL